MGCGDVGDGDNGKNGRQKSLLLDSDVGREGDARFLPLMDLSRRAVVICVRSSSSSGVIYVRYESQRGEVDGQAG